MSNTNQKDESQKNLILNNNLWSVMWSLSWPAIIAMLLYGMNTFIDGVFVGRFIGETALAGISIANALTQATLGIGSLIGVGAGSALSIALGSNDKRVQKNLMGNVNFLLIVFSLILMTIIFIFSTELISSLGGTGNVLLLANDYFRTATIATFFWIAGLSYNMIIRSEGKMKSAAVIMGIGMLVNIFSNYILIVVLDYGVKGAAWGTNIGMFVYCLLSWIYFGTGMASFKTKVLGINIDKDIIKSIFSMGFPSLIMSVMGLITAFLIFNALSKYGTDFDTAIYGISFRIFTLLLTPIFGLMRALQPVVGINFGANNYKRVMSSYRIFSVFALALVLPFWIFLISAPFKAISLMMPIEELSANVIMNFRIFMLPLPLLPLIFMGMTFFPAINKGNIASGIGIMRQLFLIVPLMLIIPRYYGVSGIYYAAAITDILVGIGTIVLVKIEFKRLVSIDI